MLGVSQLAACSPEAYSLRLLPYPSLAWLGGPEWFTSEEADRLTPACAGNPEVELAVPGTLRAQMPVLSSFR
jgi:hypothetical protein